MNKPIQNTEYLKKYLSLTSNPLEEADAFNDIIINYKAIVAKAGGVDDITVSTDINILITWRNIMMITALDNWKDDPEMMNLYSDFVKKYNL